MTVRAFQVPALVAALVAAGSAFSQVPVIDSATLTQATQTAQNTAQIMNTNQQILTTVNQTLSAVTGTRTTSTLSSLGLGSGFSMSSVPGLSSLLGGGGISMAGLGQYGSLASSIINSLNLVKTLTGASSATMPTDQAWTGAVNTAAAITAAIAGSPGGFDDAVELRSKARPARSEALRTSRRRSTRTRSCKLKQASRSTNSLAP